MTDTKQRTERDSMGQMSVPEWALWGASTQRAVENFPVSGRTIPGPVVHAFGRLKAACARVNHDLGKLDASLAEQITKASQDVAAGTLDKHFVVDVYQTGSGTSTNMNANEVIANRVSQTAGKAIGSKEPVHPNDHVNMGQSSNDTFPTAMHVGAACEIQDKLIPALERLHKTLSTQAERWDTIIKIGRTHLMDATPIRVGQVFSGYAAQAGQSVARARGAVETLCELAIGGTAVGTGINTHPDFGRLVAADLAKQTGVAFREAENHPEAQAAKDSTVDAHARLKTIAVSLSKIANDIRWLGSGPRCGLAELSLPAIQPGSSIMPGKVNPVICESVIQVAARVVANDIAVTAGGFGGVGSILELNIAMPLIADSLIESIALLTGACTIFVDKLLAELEVNADRCEQLIDQSLMMCTSLAPEIGYDQAAKLAKQAFQEGKTIRELATEQKLMPAERLTALLNPDGMTGPGDG